MEVVVTRLDPGSTTVRRLTGRLSAMELRRAGRLRLERDWRRFVVARARLRELLAERLDARPESIELACGARGKPMLAGEHAASKWQFNLAHCGDVAIYAFARGSRVGIDIEAVCAVPDAEAIAARIFSPNEHAALLSVDSSDRPLAFFNCWTRKEAFVKAVGDGIFHPYEDFDVSLAPREAARILRVGRTRGEDSGWRLDAFSPLDGFVAALVSECARPGIR